MKRYLAFAGSVYYPSGGMDDFCGDFDTQDEATSAAFSRAAEDSFGVEAIWRFRWAHVWDSQERKKVWEDGK